MTAVVVIPVYKDDPSEEELESVRQTGKVLGRHRIVLAAPQGLSLAPYRACLPSENCSEERFDPVYFRSVSGYNRLLLKPSFYRRFAAYDYLLIVQTDAWVFRDELEKWCRAGYDYIGAPWFDRFEEADETSPMLPYAGNGGFSLRHVGKTIKLLKKGFWKLLFYRYIKRKTVNEDNFIAVKLPKIMPDYKVAGPETAMFFSFENMPHKLYRLTGEKLPFGCHAYRRYNREFWNRFIGRTDEKNQD